VSAKAAIDRLRTASADDTLVSSIYLGLPPDPGERTRLETRLHSLLGPLRQFAESGELDRTARLGLRADLHRDALRVEEYRAVSVAAWDLFLCDDDARELAGMCAQVRLARGHAPHGLPGVWRLAALHSRHRRRGGRGGDRRQRKIEHVYADTPLRQHVVRGPHPLPSPPTRLNRAMTPNPILAAPPWHWWIGLFSLILDVFLLIGLAILCYRMVLQPWHRCDVFTPSRRDGAIRAAGSADGR